MIHPVALQQSSPGPTARQRLPGPTEIPRVVRVRRGRARPGDPRNIPLSMPSKLSRGRLRLVGEGEVPAQKIWRLKMETTEFAIRPPRLAGTPRVWPITRAVLALLGFAVLLAGALPAARGLLLRESADWLDAWDEQKVNVVAGTIQAGSGAAQGPEQRAVTEFIAKRYRVAQGAIADFVATAYRAGGEWKVDPLLILAVMAIESRYNPVAESNMGAKGLMQVIPKYHPEKLAEHGGEAALLDPQVNIQVGAKILREYLRRFGETETALQMYAGAFDEPNSTYAFKVLAERARLVQILKHLRRPASA